MIFDQNKVPSISDPLAYDVCIAGGGVAGITLATRLAARGHRVALLEAGDLQYSDESQQFYRGAILGRSYFDLDSARLRYLGGTSNHWEGRCRPLDDYDFERRPYFPHSGWPFAKAEIDSYREAASVILEVQPEFRDRVVVDSDNALNEIDFHFSPPVLFGDKYRKELDTSERIHVFLNANLVNIRLDQNTNSISGFEIENYNSETRHTFAGKVFVLALGGIENPRLLLNCRDQISTGIGNDTDLVGRFFMEHFHILAGFYVANRKSWPFGDRTFYLSPTKAFMDSRQIANAGLRVIPMGRRPSFVDEAKVTVKRIICSDDLILDFVQSLRKLKCPETIPVDAAGYLRIASEQSPNSDSRVLLTEKRDKFGLRRAALDWRANGMDRRTIKVMVTEFGRYVASHGYGSVKLEEWLRDDLSPIPGVNEDPWLGAGFHHMGTTRMATTAAQGVVDMNCKVFGIGNLYIAGSSVFPTGGHANPTFTIVQLALRLCDHLHRTLA